MAKILLLLKTLADDPSTAWLTDDLLAELAARGHTTDAVVFDRTGRLKKGIRPLPGGGVAHVFPMMRMGSDSPSLRFVGFVSRWLRSWLGAVRVKRRCDYDVVINFSIASYFLGFLRILKLLRRARKGALILWDFFPIHQQQLGRLPGGLIGRVLRWSEATEVRSYDHVAVMSERNRQFFDSYHPRYAGSTFIMPVWGPRISEVDPECRQAPKTGITVVFGGQLVRGRGLDQIVRVADMFRDELQGVRFLLIGDGPLRGWIEGEIDKRRVESISLVGWMDRTRYLETLRTCDIGLVITVPGVTVPTFPSKVIDFMRTQLPVIACVEPATDFGSFVEEVGFGFYVQAGDDAALVAVMRRLALETDEPTRRAMGARGHAYYRRSMTVSRIVEIMEQQGVIAPGDAARKTAGNVT